MSYFNNSPVFTGTPQAPTALSTDNSTTIATTAFVKSLGYGVGTVTAVSVTSANGITGTSSGGTTPSLTLTLGAITPTSVNGLTLTANTTGFSIAGGTTSKTLNVSNTLTLSGTDGSTLNIGTGGTLGTAAYTAASNYETALGNPAGNGYVLVSTTSGTRSWTTITGTAGSGVVLATSPTITTPTISGGATFSSGTTSVSSGAILNIPSGATLSIASGATFTYAGTPSNSTDVVNKAYVDATAQGLTPKPTARLATATYLNTTQSYTYSNGTAGVGATLTNAGTQAALTVDGIAVAVGDVILVKNEVTYPAYNGLYTVTNIGSGSSNWVLTRHVNMDSASEFLGAFIAVSYAGSGNSNSLWMQEQSVTTVGTTSVSFTQLNGATTLTQGTGISISGNIISTSAVPNASLVYSSVTIGSTSISLGSTVTTLTGLSSVSSTSFVGSLTGNATTATTATNIAGGAAGSIPYQTAAGATSLLAAGTGVLVSGSTPSWSTTPSISGANITSGTIPNASLVYSSVTIGSTSISLGSTATTISGLTSLSATTLTGTLATAAQTNITSVGTLTSLTTSGQITSTVSTGTAPFVVSSTTAVTNLSIGGNAATATLATTATNVAGGLAGSIPYQTAAGATSLLAAGTSSQVLVGGTTPTWSSAPAISGANITSGTIPWTALPTGEHPATITTTALTSNTTLTSSYDYVLCNAASGAFTITLPASPTAGMNFTIKKIDSSTNAITISGNSINIDSSTSLTLPAQWNAVTVVYNGTQWYIF